MPNVIIGFSVNPEVSWNFEKSEQLGEITKAVADFHISGTSYDVAVGLKKCGLDPILFGSVGKDNLINVAIEKDLINRGIKCELLNIRPFTPWAHIESGGIKRLAAKEPINKIDYEFINSIINLTPPADFRIITGAGVGSKEYAMNKAILEGVGVSVLGPSHYLMKNDPENFAQLAKYANWLIMNKYEAAVFCGCQPEEINLDHLEKFLDLGPDLVIITKDKDGVLMLDRQRELISLPALKIKTVDETGAGDCLIAYFVAAVHKGHNTKQALIIANIAAGLKAGRLGTVNLPSWEEVMQIY